MKHPADDQDVAGQALPEKPQGTPPFLKGGVLSQLLQKASPKTFFNFKALS
ncbi:hypothetical protein ACOZ4Y_11060 [Komagataeibacter rhaeticus]|uniref:hypothetical protein n=1 Tax=Komagataeibacter rhaeticus TaxID=215221 RepID=UPI0012EC965E|nr:hypothetical protein [Komagataeibacter rhaeticus]MBL7240357.1 hypothetical protein [Komagataeibacter rhaeticus]